jgi:hypothetical protein
MRFVILEHDYPLLHWDLMLEVGDVLRTWRLVAPPEPGCAIHAEPLGDHRKLYLDYEGPVSGNRGSVKRWDAGTFTWMTEEVNQVAVNLQGERCRGLAHLRSRAGEWFFAFGEPGA